MANCMQVVPQGKHPLPNPSALWGTYGTLQWGPPLSGYQLLKAATFLYEISIRPFVNCYSDRSFLQAFGPRQKNKMAPNNYSPHVAHSQPPMLAMSTAWPEYEPPSFLHAAEPIISHLGTRGRV